jgi:hypothetical protein
MQNINPEIDKIVQETSKLLSRMYDEFQQINISVTADYSKGAAMIVFRLGLEYYIAARDELAKERVIPGGSLVRSAIENLVDLFYIYDKQGKYPRAYVESMEAFRQIMLRAANKPSAVLANSRELKQANKWTNASIEDRIKASGPSLLNIYDILSYFGHPNPGSLTYVTNSKLKDGQLNLLKQGNCMTVLTLMGVVLNHSDIKTIKVEELDVLARKLGFQLQPD